MILVEGKLQSWGRADMVVKLLDVDLPAAYRSSGLAPGEEAPYSLEDVVEAARNCRDRQTARVYLMQQCSTCFAYYPMSKVGWEFVCVCMYVCVCVCRGVISQGFR